jgi:hypothetical protein
MSRVALALVLCSCGGPDQGQKLLSVSGEDSNAALIPGQGWNPVDGSIKGNCVTLGAMTTQSGQSAGQTADFKLLEITSETQLRESLGVSASASFGGILGKGSIRESFAQSVSKNNQSRYLLVHVRVSNQLEIATSYQFTDSAIRLLKSAQSKTFMDQCGSEFVYGRRTGGEFFAIFEFSFLSSEEDKAFSAAISASGAGWKGAAEVNTAMSGFNRFSSTQVKMYKVGASAPLPEISSISTFAANFNTLISNAQGGAVTLELITKSYEGVEPIDLRPNAELLVRQRYVLEQLGRNRDIAREQLNSIRFIKTHQDHYDLSSNSSLDDAERDFAAYLNLVNDAAVSCFEDVMKSCKLPSTVLPTVNLPAIKSGVECKNVTYSQCKLQGDDGACIAYEINTREICK